MEKIGAEIAVLEKDMTPLDLHASTFKQHLKCMLATLFEYVLTME